MKRRRPKKYNFIRSKERNGALDSQEILNAGFDQTNVYVGFDCYPSNMAASINVWQYLISQGTELI